MTYGHDIIAADAAATAAAGELLAALLVPGDVLGLVGGLGAGKTCFVQGVARGLGFVGHVPSPTFNIMLVHAGRLTLYHVDLYRLERGEQIEDIALDETVESGGVTAIEWADSFPDRMPPDRLDIRFDRLPEDRRALVPEPVGARARVLARAWVDAWRSGPGAPEDGSGGAS